MSHAMESNDSTRHLACKSAEIEVGGMTDVTIRGKLYAIYRLSSGLHVTDGLCPHEQAFLTDGHILEGDLIECPEHKARFHIPTGKAVRRPATSDITVYPVFEESGNIYITLPALRKGERGAGI